MATVVDLVSSGDTWGGLRDGYRRSQLGRPTGPPGRPPAFRGEQNTPGSDVKAPRILSSGARNNQGTNVTIPYARALYPPRTHMHMHMRMRMRMHMHTRTPGRERVMQSVQSPGYSSPRCPQA